MSIPLSNEVRALLDGPNFAHLATLMPDGSPQSVPVWVAVKMIAFWSVLGKARSKERTRGAIRVFHSPSSTSTTRTGKPSFEGAWSSVARPDGGEGCRSTTAALSPV